MIFPSSEIEFIDFHVAVLGIRVFMMLQNFLWSCLELGICD